FLGRHDVAERALREARTGSRQDRVDAHPVALEFLGRHLRQRRHGRFGRRVVGLAGVAEDTRLARGVHHRRTHLAPCLAFLAPVAGSGTRHQERTAQIDAHDDVPVLVLDVDQYAVAQDACVVDHRIEPSEGLERRVDHRGGAGGIRDVVSVGHGLAARRFDLVDHLLRRPDLAAGAVLRTAQVVDHDLRAFGGEQQCVLPADAPARARDQRDLPVQASHSRLLHVVVLGSLGRPSTRCAMMSRWISSVPPPSRMPGTPRTNSAHENVLRRPVSASSFGPSAVATRSDSAAKLAVSASFDNDISGPGVVPAFTAASALARMAFAAVSPMWTRANACRPAGSSVRPRACSQAMIRSNRNKPLPPAVDPPMAPRSYIRVAMATCQPTSTSPSRFSSGTRTPSRNTSLKSAPPVICRNGRTSTPGPGPTPRYAGR